MEGVHQGDRRPGDPGEVRQDRALVDVPGQVVEPHVGPRGHHRGLRQEHPQDRGHAEDRREAPPQGRGPPPEAPRGQHGEGDDQEQGRHDPVAQDQHHVPGEAVGLVEVGEEPDPRDRGRGRDHPAQTRSAPQDPRDPPDEGGHEDQPGDQSLVDGDLDPQGEAAPAPQAVGAGLVEDPPGAEGAGDPIGVGDVDLLDEVRGAAAGEVVLRERVGIRVPVPLQVGFVVGRLPGGRGLGLLRRGPAGRVPLPQLRAPLGEGAPLRIDPGGLHVVGREGLHEMIRGDLPPPLKEREAPPDLEVAGVLTATLGVRREEAQERLLPIGASEGDLDAAGGDPDALDPPALRDGAADRIGREERRDAGAVHDPDHRGPGLLGAQVRRPRGREAGRGGEDDDPSQEARTA